MMIMPHGEDQLVVRKVTKEIAFAALFNYGFLSESFRDSVGPVAQQWIDKANPGDTIEFTQGNLILICLGPNTTNQEIVLEKITTFAAKIRDITENRLLR